MPYIPPHRRISINLKDTPPQTIGEMNYFLTKRILNWIELQGESYNIYNEAIGLLECIKLELYRKRVSKYEDKKCKQNGEVY